MLHLLAIDTRCKAAVVRASPNLVASLVVYVFDVKGVDVAGEVAATLSILSASYERAIRTQGL